jgi:hypothetical protein
MTPTERLLTAHNIELPDTSPGRHYITCPECSHKRDRAHQHLKCLGVLIDDKGACWKCHHCEWSGPEKGSQESFDAVYEYVDESGVLLFQVCRTKDKQFPQRRPDGGGGWTWKLGDTRRVLYQLPELLESIANERTVIVTEGEKDVNSLWAIGLPATCNPGGAGKWKAEYSETLCGTDVVIIGDNDEPGRKHVRRVAAALHGVASRVRVLDLARVDRPAKDISEWLAASGTREQLDALIDALPDWHAAVADESEIEDRSEASHLISRCAADITPKPIDWLWEGRIARGKHTAIAGEPGDGKSQLSVYIASIVTTGGEWPCGEGHSPVGNVLILNAEDAADDTVVPRLMAVGADLRRVHIVSAVLQGDGKGRRTFNLQADLALLEQKIAEIGDVALIIIDPISSYMGKTDSHKNAEVRGALEPASEMAERLKVAIVSITHFSKSGAGNTSKALHRFIGSIGFVGAPRAAFAVIEDADNRGRMLFLHAKNNMAAKPPGLAYRLEQTIVGDSGIVASRVAWESSHVTITADQALQAANDIGGNRSAATEAEEFLRDKLSAGPVEAKEVREHARMIDIAARTLKRARKKLGVIAERESEGREGEGRWWLRLQECQPPCKGAKEDLGTLADDLAPLQPEGTNPPAAADPVNGYHATSPTPVAPMAPGQR